MILSAIIAVSLDILLGNAEVESGQDLGADHGGREGERHDQEAGAAGVVDPELHDQEQDLDLSLIQEIGREGLLHKEDR